MPVHKSENSRGPYYQHGKKYYYTPGNVRSRAIAKNKDSNSQLFPGTTKKNPRSARQAPGSKPKTL